MIVKKADRRGVEKHAAPDAILIFLEDARRAEKRAREESDWLANLLVERCLQVVRGEWPESREEVELRGAERGDQIGWYNPDSKRFCYTDEKDYDEQLDPGFRGKRGYTVPVYARPLPAALEEKR